MLTKTLTAKMVGRSPVNGQTETIGTGSSHAIGTTGIAGVIALEAAAQEVLADPVVPNGIDIVVKAITIAVAHPRASTT